MKKLMHYRKNKWMDLDKMQDWDILSNCSIKDSMSSEVRSGKGCMCCHSSDLSHVWGLEKSSETNFRTEFVNCTNTDRAAACHFPSDSSHNGVCEKEAS